MAAYLVIEVVAVNDAAKFDDYGKRVGAVIGRFGGRFISADQKPECIEGEWRPRTVVLVEFPNREQMKRWYDSADYRDLKAQRHAAAKVNMVLAEGIN